MLVSPLRRVERFGQLSRTEMDDLFLTTQLVSKKIEEVFQGQSLTIAIQDGPFAGQTIRVSHSLSAIDARSPSIVSARSRSHPSSAQRRFRRERFDLRPSNAAPLRLQEKCLRLLFDFSCRITIVAKVSGEAKRKCPTKRRCYANIFIRNKILHGAHSAQRSEGQ